MRAASQKARTLVDGGTHGSLGLCEISVPWWRPQTYITTNPDAAHTFCARWRRCADLPGNPYRQILALTWRGRFLRQGNGHHNTVPSHGSRRLCGGGLALQKRASRFPSLPRPPASPGTAESISLHFDNASLRLASGLLQVDWRDGRQEIFGGSATGTGGGSDPMAFTP